MDNHNKVPRKYRQQISLSLKSVLNFKNWLFILFLSSLNPIQAKHTLTIHVENCKKGVSDNSLASIQLYHRTDSGMQDMGHYYSHEKSVFSITDLDTGHYYISYLNKANREIGIRLDTEKDRDTTHITICKDRYNHGEENHLPLIMQLKNDESYMLKFGSYGCFTSTEDSFQIERTADKYYILYKNTKRILATDEYEAIQKFELGLNHYNRGGGCTNADHYELIYNGMSYKFVDASCEWNGSSILWNKLKLKKKHKW